MAERRAPKKQDERPALKRVSGLSMAAKVDAGEKLIHERLRLAIVSALAVNDRLTFGALKTMLNASDGNLSVHARKLEEAGYLTCTKGYDGRTPRTEFALTASGRRALERYLSHMESLIKAVRER